MSATQNHKQRSRGRRRRLLRIRFRPGHVYFYLVCLNVERSKAAALGPTQIPFKREHFFHSSCTKRERLNRNFVVSTNSTDIQPSTLRSSCRGALLIRLEQRSQNRSHHSTINPTLIINNSHSNSVYLSQKKTNQENN